MTTYVDVVRDTLGDQASEDHLTLAARLAQCQDEHGGRFPPAEVRAAETLGFQSGHASALFSDLRRAGLARVDMWGGEQMISLYSPPPPGIRDAVPTAEAPAPRQPEDLVARVTDPKSGQSGRDSREFVWNPDKGLQSAKQWTTALAACKCLTSWKAKMLGAVIREHVHVKDGTVYVGIQKLAETVGWYRRDVETCRNELRDAGWLVDTGERKGRAIVFRLDIPCGCLPQA